jgi:ABC-2 type transport system permease protein
MARFLAVLGARNREFLRDRSALAWNIMFPVLIVFGFAFAFSGESIDLYKVGVYGGSAQHGPSGSSELDFFHTRYIQFIPVTDLRGAITKVKRHQLDMLFDLSKNRYWVNDTSPRGYFLERVLHGSTNSRFAKETVTGRQIRYVDWLIPGVLGMNMMFSALFGVGYVIVRYRKNGVLKRLKATPLTAFEFLAAQVVSRLWLIIVLTVLVYVGTDFFIDFTMFGSYVTLLLVFSLGAVSVISLGLMVAARISSEEFAGGMLNLISWPMMFFSGVWFSLEGTNPLVQKVALVFPLTHVIDGARAVMLDGATLADIAPQLVILGVMSAVFLAIGSYTFRWE